MPVPARRATPETFIATFVAASVAMMAGGYVLDAAGLAMAPALLGVAAAAAGGAAFVSLREGAAPPGSIALTLLVTASAFAYLLWLASPSLLPVTDGPDVVHHLQLIHFIQRTQRLPHDPALAAYLAEMMNYTPGSHIVVAGVGAWLRVDPLRVLLPVTAAFVAVKAGIVYGLAVRALPPARASVIAALAAPVLLLVPAAFTIRSFFRFYFHAQVVSETFAVAMVLASVAWVRTRESRWLAVAAASGVGVVLSWPVWIGPAAAAAAAAMLGAARPVRARLVAIAAVCLPAALFAGFHALTHSAGVSIVGSSGAVTRPSAEVLSVAFVALAAVGAILAVRIAPARAIVVLLGVTILQALAIAALDLGRSASPDFYIPFKMVYLAVVPCAVLGALALATAADVLASRLPAVRAVAPLVPLLIAMILAGGRFPVRRAHSPITTASLAAGTWARANLPAGCLDYFSRHWLTGYWLHLDVLGNPRVSERMRVETFDFPDVVGKWIQGKGLPYAIVEDLDAVPRDARADMVTLRTFPPAVVVKNARALRPGSDPDFQLCAGK